MERIGHGIQHSISGKQPLLMDMSTLCLHADKLMRKVLVILLGLISFSYCVGSVPAGLDYWIDHLKSLPLFVDKPVTALGVAENHLYIAAGEDLFVMLLDGTALEKVTPKIRKTAGDQVTDIFVDATTRTLWLGLNGSLNSARGYSYAFAATQVTSKSLNKKIMLYEKLVKNAPQHSSISALDFDAQRAVVGFVKGNVYCYSFKKKNYRLIYKPTNPYSWPVSAVLAKDAVFVAVPGDGLIIFDEKSKRVTRLYDKSPVTHIQTLATDKQNLYIGYPRGVVKIKLRDLLQRGSNQ
ncbi:MAG: hypothetical protein HY080_16645 [Gammaproteobacteria bacterium]|nr:hypothetical protein [Gammaproteobacteria bacterium]